MSLTDGLQTISFPCYEAGLQRPNGHSLFTLMSHCLGEIAKTLEAAAWKHASAFKHEWVGILQKGCDFTNSSDGTG